MVPRNADEREHHAERRAAEERARKQTVEDLGCLRRRRNSDAGRAPARVIHLPDIDLLALPTDLRAVPRFAGGPIADLFGHESVVEIQWRDDQVMHAAAK